MRTFLKKLFLYSGPAVVGIYIGQSYIWNFPFRYFILSIITCIYILAILKFYHNRNN
jgi:hypothetical protein